MANVYNVLIIGSGNIGAFFDNSSCEEVLTHAHAFSKLHGFNLLGFVDVNREKCKEAASLWNVQAFNNIEEAFENNIDIVCICAPDEYHYEILKKISGFSLKLIFTEKPLTKSLAQAKDIMKLYDKKNISCAVNYSRRFVPEFAKVKEEFLQGDYGKFICGNGYYGKGVLHNGSHLIDILRYIIGDIKRVETLSYDYDFYEDDPSVSANLVFENGERFIVQNIPCNNYTIFEIDLLFENKRIRITDSGFKIEIYEVLNSETFKGYKNIIKTTEQNTTIGKALENAALNIYNYLEYGEKLKCTLKDGYKAVEICELIKAGI